MALHLLVHPSVEAQQKRLILTISGPLTTNSSSSPDGGSEVAARALSLPDLSHTQCQVLPLSLENDEHCTMEREISRISHMIDDMEMKVNVLRWMVEPHERQQHTETLSSTDSASLALLSVDEEQQGPHPFCQPSQIYISFLLLAVFLVATTLSVSVIFFT